MKVLLLSLAVLLAGATISQAAPTVFNVTLTGAAEVAAGMPGDPNGIGNGTYTFDPDADTISWILNYSNMNGTSFNGYHIHGPATTSQSVGVYRGFTINAGATPPNGTLSGTLTVTDDPALSTKIDTILAAPHMYYVNLHSQPNFAGGAIRAQLPEPTTLTLLACGAMGLMIRRRKI